jgi:hypothetical protein
LINLALAGLSIVFAYLYFTKPQNVTKNIVKVENVKPVVKKEFKSLSDVKAKLIDSDIGLIYIDCFQFSTDGRFDYCFRNKQGDIVRPEYVGYKVLSNGECHVKLVRDEVVLDVYCDPIIRKQETINTNDEILVTSV